MKTNILNVKPFIQFFSNKTANTIGLAIFFSIFLSLNVKATDISGTFASDVILSAVNNPYVLTGDVVMESGATLIIEPGVEIQSNNTGRDIVIFGALQAVGTVDQPILFTSSNGNGGGSLAIRENATANMGFIEFENLGISTLSFYETGLYLYDANVTANNLSFTNCGLNGGSIHVIADANAVGGFGPNNNIEQIRFISNSLNGDAIWPNVDPNGFTYGINGDQVLDELSTLTIEAGVEINLLTSASDIIVFGSLVANAALNDNILITSTNVEGGGSLALRDGSVASINYVTFENLGFSTLSFFETGLYIYDAQVIAGNLSFTNCGLQGGTINMVANANSLGGFESNNLLDQVRILSAELDGMVTWPDLDPSGFNYILAADQVIDLGTTLTIEPGVDIDFNQTGVDLIVFGELNAVGTFTEPLRFYSTAANGGGSVAYRDGSIGNLQYVGFEELGRTTLSFFEAGLYIYNAEVTADFLSFLNCGVGNVSIDAPPYAVDNFGGNNEVDQVRLRAGVLGKNSVWPLLDMGEFNYTLNGDVDVDAGFELTIEPGVEVDLTGTGVDLLVNGILNANGSETRVFGIFGF